MSLFSFIVIYNLTPPPGVDVPGGSWGSGEWGPGPWGASKAAPPQISGVSPSVVDELGGNVVLLTGENFNVSAAVTLLSGTQVVGNGVIVDLDFDLTESQLYVGMPALPTGFYDLRIATNGGSYVFANAVESRPFAYELKTEDVRRKWGRAWNLGTRQLGTGG